MIDDKIVLSLEKHVNDLKKTNKRLELLTRLLEIPLNVTWDNFLEKQIELANLRKEIYCFKEFL